MTSSAATKADKKTAGKKASLQKHRTSHATGSVSSQRRSPRGTASSRAQDLPFSESIGYQIRMTHRTLQRLLQLQIEPHGITLGMWYFLRALWHEDGLTQRDLSRRTGTTEPTALIAIQSMERRGLVRRAQGKADRRKWHVHLTAKGKALKPVLIPLARGVVSTASKGIPAADISRLMRILGSVQKNMQSAVDKYEGAADESVTPARSRRS